MRLAWDDPMISGIGWVSELVEAAGGIDVLAEKARQTSAKDRIVQPADVIAAAPDIVIGSWCGKKLVPARVAAADPAARAGRAHRWARCVGGDHGRLGESRRWP